MLCSQVEWATLNWVYWWNNHLLHESLGYATPEEIIASYNQHQVSQPTPASKAEQNPGYFSYLASSSAIATGSPRLRRALFSSCATYPPAGISSAVAAYPR